MSRCGSSGAIAPPPNLYPYSNFMTPSTEAQTYLAQGQYTEAASAYEAAIEIDPDNAVLCWNYGIALLLSDQEEAAQSVWMSVLMNVSSEESQQELISQLIQALNDKAIHCESRNAFEESWILRRYQCELAPADARCARDAVLAGLQGQRIELDDDVLEHLNALAAESNQLFSAHEIEKTCQLLRSLLMQEPTHPAVQAFTHTCAQQVQDTVEAERVAELLRDISWQFRSQSRYLSDLVRSAVQLSPTNPRILEEAIDTLSKSPGDRRLAIQLIEQLISVSETPIDRLRAMDTLLARLMQSGGQVQRAQQGYMEYKAQLDMLADAVAPLEGIDPLEDPKLVSSYVERLGRLYALISVGFSCLYFEDKPQRFRAVRNRLAMAAQAHAQTLQAPSVKRFREFHDMSSRRLITRPLRIGYLANTFRQHSVGWLCRWLLKYHDRDRFDVHLYTPTTQAHDFVQESLVRTYGDRFHVVPTFAEDISEQIFQDQIDILIDLDSMTNGTTLLTLASKPAPIQVSWLGYDASGLPAVDYFIADPYVLPDSAETYYQERIWRLPQTYIAVDGFETYTPTLSRRDLDIPPDAIVYISSQTGFKRNVRNVKLQLQILKALPNSYLLIKSATSDPESIQPFFFKLAKEVGVPADRLRFLPDFPSEFTYRANLQLADVVLDTYPYNGATTTLEALWMGLPIVTRVGEQFAARNSYTMMVNAGITEGIAWSDDEYVEWGIRLGQDEPLRRDVVWKLHQSRHTAPLWNTKRFAQDMENAYEQMWQHWCDRPTS